MKHNKTIANEEKCKSPHAINLFQDNSCQRYVLENIFIVQPYKKPRKGKLSELKKWVARLRITIQHAIKSLKRCRILKDKYRHFYQRFRGHIMVIYVGLHNFRVGSPFRVYKSKFKWDSG